jgi:hypothetical protein
MVSVFEIPGVHLVPAAICMAADQAPLAHRWNEEPSMQFQAPSLEQGPDCVPEPPLVVLPEPELEGCAAADGAVEATGAAAEGESEGAEAPGAKTPGATVGAAAGDPPDAGAEAPDPVPLPESAVGDGAGAEAALGEGAPVAATAPWQETGPVN